MLLEITQPIPLQEVVVVVPDTTTWKSVDHLPVTTKRGKAAGRTPDRDQASYGAWQKALQDHPTRHPLRDSFGLYFLFFNVPSPHLYIGIAANGGRSPEGVLNRIKKHVVKATGSHVGNCRTVNGGVDHTEGWRTFAKTRALTRVRAAVDTCEDAMLALGRVTDAECRLVEDMKTLGLFESCIARDTSGALGQLAVSYGVPSLSLITKKSGAPRNEVRGNVIRYWSGFELSL